MSTEHTSKTVLRLCDRALEVPDGEREDFLNDNCGDDARLRASVDSILIAVGEAGQFLTRNDTDGPSSRDMIGRQIGQYTIRERLGEGGMGSVYLADRHEEGFEQRVAIKLVHGHMLANELIERFNAERQILASLNHPYIAALIDGGTTTSGVPYLVMEYIDGEPIDEYCDKHRLDFCARIKLIQKVAMAVQAAHQNLVVHRDLKPSNVLVTKDGIPKLLDFGIAKLIQAEGPGESGNTTVFGHQAMTPDYASPEQILENRVTTASDVYTLGILTYHLLVGERPYRIPTGSHREMVQSVEALTIPRPSERLNTVASRETRELLARHRATTVSQQRRSLQGDLDNIVLMALRQEPSRRYHSVAQFSDDLGKYLKGLPVAAREDSFRYRSRKFLQRHWVAAAAGSVVFLSLAAGLLGYASQAREAQKQRDIARDAAARAESTVDFLKDVLFIGNPFETTQDEQTIADVLNYAADHVTDEYAGDPASRAGILTALGDIYSARGEYERSQALTKSAVEIYESDLVPSGNAAANTYRAYGLALFYVDDYRQSNQMFERAIELYLAAPDPDWLGLVRAYDQVAQVQGNLTDETSALAYFERALSTYRDHDLKDPSLLAAILGNMGTSHLQLGNYDEADAVLSEAIDVAIDGDIGNASLGQLRSNYAGALKNMGKLEQAVAEYTSAADVIASFAGPEHPETIVTLTSLANLLQQMDRLDEAETTIRRAVDAAGKSLAPDRFVASYAQNVAGVILCRTGSADDGLTYAHESLQTRRDLLPPNHWAIASGAGVVGACLTSNGRFQEAEEQLLPALKSLRDALGSEHEVTIATLSRLQNLYAEWGRPAEAARYSSGSELPDVSAPD